MIWRTSATTPTWYSWDWSGSLSWKSRWVTRNILRLPPMASFRAITDFSRPTSKWSIMLGNRTSPRRASTGISSVICPLGRAVTFFFVFSFSSMAMTTFLVLFSA